MTEPIFLKGVLQEKIWGGSKLREIFGYDIPSEKTGELWAISAHKNGPAVVADGDYKGQTLTELWDHHRELFGNQEGDVFPLLTKIIDAENDLSVQVHPDDTYGMKHEGELGKTECWYIIDAEKDSEIIFGHHAKTRDELKKMIEEGKWEELLYRVKVKAGDFFYVPSGTIHAIGAGIMILETQQSSDTTYRVYDYDRKDDNGNLRDLHIKQSIDVTTVPQNDPTPEQSTVEKEGAVITTLVDNSFFTVQKWEVNGRTEFSSENLYTLVSVLDGEGILTINKNTYELSKGDHFILPNDVKEWTLQGTFHIIASNPGK